MHLKSNFLSKRSTYFLVFSAVHLIAGGSCYAEDEGRTESPVAADTDPFKFNFRLATYADSFVSGDADRGIYFSTKLDAKLGIDGAALGLWPGFFVNAHFEYADGEDINTAGDGSIWPVNTHTSLPRQTGNKTTLSLTATQALTKNLSVTLGKFNLVEASNNTPLVGGANGGGFNYLGFVAPPSFVAPPYALGGQVSLKTQRVDYSLLVYDPRSAQGSEFWKDPFQDIVFNVSATFKTNFANLPGFYTLNYVHNTAEGLDFDSLLFEPGTTGFRTTQRGYDYAAFKFQQYLYTNPEIPNNGWGIFGQLAIGDSNPHPFGISYLIGIGGNAPFYGREQDRWGIALSHQHWSDKLVDGLAAVDTFIEDEIVVELFYEATIYENFRIGANLQFINPGISGFDDAVLIGTRARIVF